MAKKKLILSSFDNWNLRQKIWKSFKYRYIDIYFKVLRTKDQNWGKGAFYWFFFIQCQDISIHPENFDQIWWQHSEQSLLISYLYNATHLSLSFQTLIALNIIIKSQVFWHCFITDNKSGCMRFWKEVWQLFKSQVTLQQKTKQPSSGKIFLLF